MIERIHWLGRSSFRINGPPHADGAVIYIDPWKLPAGSPPADLILVSRDHFQNCSPDDIAKIRTGHTVILGSQRVAERLGSGVQVLRPWGGSYRVGDVSVTAVPAYSTRHAYYGNSTRRLGCVSSLTPHDIYYAGATELIPEMEKIGCDIALLPVGGEYTMQLEDALEAVRRIRPYYVVPITFDSPRMVAQNIGRRFCNMVNGGSTAVLLPVENDNLA